MSIDLGSNDTERIDITEPREVCLWMQRLSCSEAQLRTVVAAVGPLAEDVTEHLGQPLLGASVLP